MGLYDLNTTAGGVVAAMGDSGSAGGSVTAPGVGAAVASLAAPGAGVYMIRVHTRLTGTAETAALNLELRHGATVVGKCAVTLLTELQTIEFSRVTVAAAETISANATAAATAGAIYNVLLVATRVG